MNAAYLYESIPLFLKSLGTVETHFASLLLIHFTQNIKTSGFLSKTVKLASTFYILGAHLLNSLYQPTHTENIYRMTGLQRFSTSPDQIESMLGDLEDKFIGDDAKQEYISELEEKLLGDSKSYFLMADDYFGDQFKGLSFDGKISTQMEIKIGEVIADFVIFAYSTMIFLAPGTGRPLKFSLLVVLGLAGYSCYTVYEFGGDQKNFGNSLLKKIFEIQFFAQFCIFNVIELWKNIASFTCSLLVVISYLGYVRKSDLVEKELEKVFDGDVDGVAGRLDGANQELKKIAEEKEKKFGNNKKYLRIMIWLMILAVIYFKGENFYFEYKAKRENK